MILPIETEFSWLESIMMTSTNSSNTPHVSEEGAIEHRARVISVGGVGGDSSANPSPYTEVLSLAEKRTMKVSPNILTDRADERGLLQIGKEILVTFVTGTDEVDRIISSWCGTKQFARAADRYGQRPYCGLAWPW